MTIPSPIDVVALAALAAPLDEATHEQRIAWIRGLNRKELSALYDLAEGGPALGVSHFHAGPDEVIIHHGQNSLPAFNQFQKRVVSNGGDLQGYNTRPWAGSPDRGTSL